VVIASFLLEQICWAGDTSAQYLPANPNNPSGGMTSNDLKNNQLSAQGMIDAKNAVTVMAASTPAGTTNTYYSNGTLASATLATPDASGMVYL